MDKDNVLKKENDELVNKVKSEPNDSSENTDKPKEIDENGEIKKESDPLLELFYNEIDDIKPEDFKTNSKEQLDRLLRPGSTYFNLNPFEVLQVDPYCSVDEIKKKYRKLSIYVHPDKNPHDLERAKIAFEAVNRSYKLLDNDKDRKKCLEVVDEARDQVNKMCEEKRKKKRKELLAANPTAKKGTEINLENVKIEEDDPDKYRHAVYVITCKLFADIERLKVKELEKKAEEKKRKAQEKDEDESKTKVQKEWDKNYEDSREGRVSSWKNFVTKKGGASNITNSSKSTFKLPKHKPESR